MDGSVSVLRVAWIVRHHADRRPGAVERLPHPLRALSSRHAAVRERQLDIFGDGEIADQVEGLEHEADPPVADAGSLRRREIRHGLVLEQVAPVARRIEQAEDGEERRLAASRRAVDRDVLALADLEVHVGERVRLDLVGEEDLADTLQLNERRTVTGHRVSPYFSFTLSTLSYRVMSDRITESPAASPCTISIALTEVRP